MAKYIKRNLFDIIKNNIIIFDIYVKTILR